MRGDSKQHVPLDPSGGEEEHEEEEEEEGVHGGRVSTGPVYP